MNVLIIGGTRRCGPHIVKLLLERGHSVTCFHRGEHQLGLSDRARYVHGDRRDYRAFVEAMAAERPDVVVDTIAFNDEDVEAVVEAFTGRIQRYVCVSSYEVYEAFEAAWNHTPSLQPLPIPEGAPKRQATHLYGQEMGYDKLLVERAAMEAHARGDFNVCVLRWPALYGPEDPLIREWYYVKQAVDGRESIALPEGGQALFPRGHFLNMAHTAILAVENQAADGQIYNATDVETLSLRQIVMMIGEILDHRWEIVSIPRRLMPPATRSQGLPHSSDPYDIDPHLLLDLGKIRVELGYHDLVSITEGMKEAVTWLKENPPENHWLTVDYEAIDAAIRKV